MIKTHYGRTVDSTIPVTGVLNTTEPEWWVDEILKEGIDLDYHEWSKTHDDNEEEFFGSDSPDYLVNFKLDEQKNFIIDESKEYSAIVNGNNNTTQVIKSVWVQKVSLCSPCYPGQGDLDSKGDFLAFTLPPEIWGERSPISEIFKLKTEPILSESEAMRMLNLYASGPLSYTKKDDSLLEKNLISLRDNGTSVDVTLPSSEFFNENGKVNEKWFSFKYKK